MNRRFGLAVAFMVAVLVSGPTGCRVLESTPPPLRAQVATVTGKLSHQGPVTLPAGTIAEVTLSDVSRMDTDSIELAQMRFPAEGRTLPLAFELGYDPGKILPGRPHFYAISARLLGPGETLLWVTDTANYLPPSPAASTDLGALNLVRVR